MTYEEFKSSAKLMTVDQAAAEIGIDPLDYGLSDYESVLVYAGGCFIGVLPESRGFHLFIETDEWVSSCLSDLTPKLYDWAFVPHI